jgi:hypothetical protein
MKSAAAVLLAASLHASKLLGQTVDTFFVAHGGRDTWSGRRSVPQPNLLDGPFASLERAREAARASARNVRGAVVQIEGGDWFLKNSLVFTQADGGKPARPVKWGSYPGTRARLIGGVSISNWSRDLDPAIRTRLPQIARDSLLVAPIPVGVNVGPWTTDGRNIRPAPDELVWGGRLLTLPRWPDSGWDRVASVDSANRVTIRGHASLPRSWTDQEGAWAFGYFFWDWSASYVRIVGIDPQTNTLMLDHDPVYGIRANQRFAILNLPEALKTSGAYWIDEKARRIYVWPPSGRDRSSAILTTISDPLVDLQHVSDFVIDNVDITAGRGTGIRIQSGSRIRLDGIGITELGGRGLEIQEGYADTVHGVRIQDVGEDGIWLSGGDRTTLTSSAHLIEQVRIARFARWVRTYAPGIHLTGVGTTVRQCDISDAPHSGIVIEGNDHVIENNSLHDLVFETSDAGAIYIGRDWTARGNIIRGNYFYDIAHNRLSSSPLAVPAIYIDDMASGVTVADNIVDHDGLAVLIGGGRDNVVEDNVILRSSPWLYEDARGRSLKAEAGKPGSVWDYLVNIWSRYRPDTSPYATRFPKLRSVLTDQPDEPLGNVLRNNVVVGGGAASYPELRPDEVIETGTLRLASQINTPWSRIQVQALLDSLAAAHLRSPQKLPRALADSSS